MQKRYYVLFMLHMLIFVSGIVLFYALLFSFFSPLSLLTLLIMFCDLYFVLALLEYFLVKHTKLQITSHAIVLCLPFRLSITYNYAEIQEIVLINSRGVSVYALAKCKVSLVFKRSNNSLTQSKFSLFVKPGAKRVIRKLLLSPENANEFFEVANQKLRAVQ